eukprot:6470689-Amphidinium_carterae.1
MIWSSGSNARAASLCRGRLEPTHCSSGWTRQIVILSACREVKQMVVPPRGSRMQTFHSEYRKQPHEWTEARSVDTGACVNGLFLELLMGPTSPQVCCTVSICSGQSPLPPHMAMPMQCSVSVRNWSETQSSSCAQCVQCELTS